MAKKYQPSMGGHKRGPQPGHNNLPEAAPRARRCRCGKDAIPMNGECYKCGRWLPGYKIEGE